MAQFARPTTDITDGGWTTDTGSTTLAPAIDETVASDADYIQSGSNPSNDTVEIKFGSVTDPASSSGHIVRYRLALDAGGATGAVVSLMQGTTEIAAWNEAVLTTTPQTFARTLTAAQADAITNYGDLRLNVVAQDYALRDVFATPINPLVDGAAEPGPGNRDETGGRYIVADGALLKGTKASGTTLDSRVAWPAVTRAMGRVVQFLWIPDDMATATVVGLLETPGTATPLTDGYGVQSDYAFRVTEPARQVAVSGSASSSRETGPREYLVTLCLLDQGAVYLLSTVNADRDAAIASDPIGIPAFPDTRVIYVSDTGTTASLYPAISAAVCVDSGNPYPNGNTIKDLRVVDPASWTTQGPLTYLDRVTRADSAVSPGGSFVTGQGTYGVSSNQLYWVSSGAWPHTVFRAGSDGIFRCRVTAPTTPTNGFGVVLRQKDANNFLRLWNDSTSAIKLQSWVGGAFNTTHFSTGFTWTGGQTYELVVIMSGSLFKILIDGADPTGGGGWQSCTVHTDGTGYGPFLGATGARWDDFMFSPLTLTLPAALQLGESPRAWTVGGTLYSDDFAAADGTNLNGRSLDTGGQAWTVHSGTATIQSNEVDAPGGLIATVPEPASDYEISVNVGMEVGGTSMLAGVVLGYNTSNGTYVAVRALWGSGDTSEIEVVENFPGGGGFVGVAHKIDLKLSRYSPGNRYTLTAQKRGKWLRVFLDGQIKISHRITNTITGDRCGIYEQGNTTTRWDAFRVKALSAAVPQFGVRTDATGTVTGQTIAISGSAVTGSDGSGANSFPTIGTAVLARYRAGAEGLADGTAVGQFTDQSGNGRHATQGTAANKPTLKTNIVNGKSVYRFDGTNDSVSIPSWTPGTGTLTFYVVLQTNNSGATHALTEHSTNFNTPNNAWLINKNTTNNIQGQIHGVGGAYATFTTTGTIGASFVVLRVLLDMSLAINEATVELNHSTAGTRPSNSDNSGNFSAQTTYIGARAGSSLFWNGDIAEFVILGGDPSSGDKSALDAYFLAEYGV